MFVVYVDLEQTGRSKPVPCAQFKPVELLGDGWYKLVGVEQIKELARPTMEGSELIIQRKHIECIIGGTDPSEINDMLSAPMVADPIENTDDQDTEDHENEVEPINLEKPKSKIGRTKGNVGRPKGSKNKKTTKQKK